LAYEESYDETISSLFQDAVVKLDKVDAQAKESKKQIIIDLAKSLEGKIPTDTICIEIINQLRGQVSERFIRECLDEKYKQKVRVENARKQKYQTRQEEEDKASGKLAAVTPLNQEVEEDEENKKVIILDTDGRISLQDEEEQEEEEGQPYTTTTDSFTITGKPFVATSYQQQQQEQEIKEQTNNGLEESSSCIGLCDENQVYSPEKSSQLITTAEDGMLVEEISSASTNENDMDILPFEFSMIYRELRNHLAPLHTKIGDGGKVWFSGKINKKTGEVVSSNLGRMNIQQDRSSP
jgi:hypothetical protein